MAALKKHEQVLAAMRADLAEWPPDAPFLTDAQAMARYGASRITVRHAFSQLQAEGQIQRIRHFGTRLCPRSRRPIRQIAAIGWGFLQNGIEMELNRGIDATLSAAGIQLLYASTMNSAERTVDAIERVAALGVDGVILCPPFVAAEENHEIIRIIQEKQIPLVVALRLIAGLEDQLHYVIPDNYGGAMELTRQLLGLGHRRIGFFHQYPLESLSRRDSRYFGHAAAMRQAGLEPDPTLNFELPLGSIPLMLQQWRQMADPPTAMIFNDDVDLFAFLDAAQSLGLRVPEEVSAAGFDNQPRFGIRHTSVNVPYFEIGQTAALHLINLIRNPALQPGQTVLPVSVVLGATTTINPRLQATA